MIFPEISERFLSRGRILLFSNRGLDGCRLSEYFTKFKIRTAFFCCWRGTRKGLGVLLITHFRLHFTCGRGEGGAERSNISDQSSPVHTIMTARSHLTIMVEIISRRATARDVTNNATPIFKPLITEHKQSYFSCL